MGIVIVPEDELYHYGIIGQRWYHRRYQHEDGTLTEEGKMRYRKGGRTAELGKKLKSAAKSAASSMGSGIKSAASKVANETSRMARKKMGPKYMTDQELRDATNRMNLEKNYRQTRADLRRMSRPQFKFARQVLGSVGTALSNTVGSIAGATATMFGGAMVNKMLGGNYLTIGNKGGLQVRAAGPSVPPVGNALYDDVLSYLYGGDSA